MLFHGTILEDVKQRLCSCKNAGDLNKGRLSFGPGAIVIAADGKIIIVWIRRAEPFRRTPGELDAENHEQLTLFRSFPGSADIIREFRVYSKYGSLRFFRVEDSRLLEIGRDGLPLAALGGKPGPEKPGKGGKGA
ncbi:MAG: hypothetical protein WCX22_02155 [Methanoregula sp.]